jgi:hypothetical protein
VIAELKGLTGLNVSEKWGSLSFDLQEQALRVNGLSDCFDF